MNWRKHLFEPRYTSKDYPELDLFSDEDRRTVVRAYGRSTGWWIAFLAGTLPLCVVTALIPPLVSRVCPSAPRLVSTMIAAAYVGLVLGFFQKILSRPIMRKYLRSELNKRGIRVCMSCGYDLTGNTSSVCPECGRAI